jgi:hypothetical protein
MEPLLAISWVSAIESVSCAILLVHSFHDEFNDKPAADTTQSGGGHRQFETRKQTKMTSHAAIEPTNVLLVDWETRSKAVTGICSPDFAFCEDNRKSLDMCKNLDGTVRLLEAGVSRDIAGTCPMLTVQRASSLLKRLSSKLGRPLNTVRWNRHIRDQKANEKTQCPANRTLCTPYDTESQEWNPELENMSSYLSVLSRTNGRTQNYGGPRLHSRRIWNRCNIPATRLLRLVGSISFLYPACMVVMSNYAITRGMFTGCGSWSQSVLRVSSSLTNFKKQIDKPQLPISHIQPSFISHPSPALMFTACMTWAVLEWAHYFSNEDDRYQNVALVSAICIGLLPAIGCWSSALAALLCIVPWAVHLGLVVSDVLHRSRFIAQ